MENKENTNLINTSIYYDCMSDPEDYDESSLKESSEEYCVKPANYKNKMGFYFDIVIEADIKELMDDESIECIEFYECVFRTGAIDALKNLKNLKLVIFTKCDDYEIEQHLQDKMPGVKIDINY